MDRKCLTPGMILHTKITDTEILIKIDMPQQKWIEVAEEIDNRIHDGIEYALAPFWEERS